MAEKTKTIQISESTHTRISKIADKTGLPVKVLFEAMIRPTLAKAEEGGVISIDSSTGEVSITPSKPVRPSFGQPAPIAEDAESDKPQAVRPELHPSADPNNRDTFRKINMRTE